MMTPGICTLTHEGHDEDTDGEDPGDLAVALVKLLHQVLEEDAEALDGAVGENLHQEEGHGHQPAPAAVWDFFVLVGAEKAASPEPLRSHGRGWAEESMRVDVG